VRALLTWLDVHGAAVQGAAAVVQAGAALVTVVLTVVLIRVTTKYVRLTEQLARAATDEEQYRQIAARGRRAELAGLLDRLRQSVGGDRRRRGRGPRTRGRSCPRRSRFGRAGPCAAAASPASCVDPAAVPAASTSSTVARSG